MIGKPRECIEWLFNQDREKLYEIKEHKEKRSLNANSYAWSLIGKIAEAIGTTKDDIYLRMLEDYGQSILVPLPVGSNPSGYFKYYEYLQTSQINGKDADWYKVIKGSSDYNTKEMAVLIDGIIQEAKDLEIDTLPPDEIERLKEMWK